MEIQFGEFVTKKVFRNGIEVGTKDYSIVRERCVDDKDELAKFLQFQKEAKDSPEASFTRELSGNGNRYVVRSWRR